MTNNYIDNAEMLRAFIKHKKNVDEARKNGLPEPRVPDYIGECFCLLADRVGSRGNFSSYTYLDEMKNDGVESCIIGANNFDPNKTVNPFGYFTKAIWFAFLRRIEREKKQNYIKFKLKQNLIISTDENINVNGGTDDLKVMDNIISDFEDSIERKKKKSAGAVEIKKNGTRFVRRKKHILDKKNGDNSVIKENTNELLIARFLAKGGKIRYIPTGVKSVNLPDLEEPILAPSPEEVNELIPPDDIEDSYGDETADD